VSQSIAGACCTLGISTLPGYPRWEKEAVWRPTITWRRTTAKELASAHLSWSEAQHWWQLEEYCVGIMLPMA